MDILKLPASLPGHWETGEGLAMAVDYAGKERAELSYGDRTDLVLANDIFMASRDDLRLINYQTAAKERIRWLSVQLAIANARASELCAQISALEQSNTVLGEMLQMDEGAWRSIESAPKDGTPVLLYFPKRYQGKGGISWGLFSAGRWLDSRATIDNDATHWMPLPAPPNRTAARPDDRSDDSRKKA